MEPRHPATSIFQFLTHPNPSINHAKSKSRGKTTTGDYMIPKQMRKWKEFNIQCLETIDGGRLREEVHRANRSLLYPTLTDPDDAKVHSEPGTREVLSSWNRKVVTMALESIHEIFNTVVWLPCKRQVVGRVLSPPEVGIERVQPARRSSTQARQPPKSKTGRFFPDSGSVSRGSEVERFVKEYKCGSFWTSEEFFSKDPLDEDGMWKKEAGGYQKWAWPIRQAYTYCVAQKCRYGCILSCKEAFIFRIQAIKTNTEAPGTKTDELESSLMKGGIMDYVSIPWSQGSAEDQLETDWTVNLALWFLHILAGNSYEVDYGYKPLADEKLGEGKETTVQQTADPLTPTADGNSSRQTPVAGDDSNTTLGTNVTVPPHETHTSGSETDDDVRRVLEPATPRKRKRSLIEVDESLYGSFSKHPIRAQPWEPPDSSPGNG